MNITLPPDLYQKLEQRVHKSSEFESVDAYVCYILEEVLQQVGDAPSEVPGAYTKDQEAVVKKRLEDLGYLD